MLIFAASFLAASLGAYGLGSRWSAASLPEDAQRRLAPGMLALVHAKMEEQAHLAGLLTSTHGDLTRLKTEIGDLEKQLTLLTGQVESEKTAITEMTRMAGDKESMQKGFIAEKQRLETLLAAFAAASGKRKEADAALQAALGSGTGQLSPADLDAWKAGWANATKEATGKIEDAKTSLKTLEAKEDEWIQGKGSLQPDQQKAKQQELRTLHASASQKVEDARTAAAAAEMRLLDLITTQRAMLAAAMTPPAP